MPSAVSVCKEVQPEKHDSPSNVVLDERVTVLDGKSQPAKADVPIWTVAVLTLDQTMPELFPVESIFAPAKADCSIVILPPTPVKSRL